MKYSCPASTQPCLLYPTQRICCSKNGTGRCSLSPYHIISDEVDASAGSDSPIPARGMSVEQSGLSRSPCECVHHHDTNIEAPRPCLNFWHQYLFLSSPLRCNNVAFEDFDDAIGTKLYHAIPTPPGAMQQTALNRQVIANPTGIWRAMHDCHGSYLDQGSAGPCPRDPSHWWLFLGRVGMHIYNCPSDLHFSRLKQTEQYH